jgi:hypothetical protein
MRSARHLAATARRSGTAALASTLVWAVILMPSLILSTPASAQITPQIVNGLNSHGYPTTGMLLYSGGAVIDGDNASSWCSGTLIGCRTFLTAGHCVEDDDRADRYQVYLQHSGVHAVSSITSHPSYMSYSFPLYDIAVIKLEESVTGIEPSPVNTIESPPVGTSGTIVGFGRTGGAAADYGIKRAGLVETTDCAGIIPPLTNAELVCWDFVNPIGPPGDDSNTCNADSGGPLLVSLGGNVVVAGVTSGGTSNNCLAPDDSYDANVFTYLPFILDALGSDPTSTCGGLPPVGDPDVTVIGNDGTLGAGNTADTFTVQVTEPTAELRVALTGEDNGSFDVDFYVKEGPGAGPGSFDCAAAGASNGGACVFSNPAQGDWSISVNRFSGSGEYQVTTTIFAPGLPTCGNDVREVGEECDGTDDAGCPGECLLGCSCPVCPSAPATGCTTGEPGRSSITITDNDDDSRDRFKWNLGQGGATDVSAFFSPQSTTLPRYRLCIYDATGGGTLTAAEVPPMGTCAGRPCWKATGKKGFKYKDNAGAVAGITDITLRAGDDGKSQIQVKGRGVGFETPAPPLQTPVTAQLTITDGESAQCWQTTFASPSRNEPGAFKSKGP